jgi:hypothetical protein
MGNATGVELKAALKKAAAWGTAVACGANDGVLVLPHSLKKDRPNNIDDSLGLYFPNDSDPGAIKVEGDVPAYLRYDGLDLLIALAMGETGGAPTQPDNVNDPNTYQQVFTLADSLDGLFATFPVDNRVHIDEYPSLKVTGFTLKGEVGKPLEVSFHCIGDDRLVDSSVNTAVTFANVTYFETGSRVLMSQGVIRMNDASSAALGAGDEIYPSSFELSFKRNMAGVYGAGGVSDKIDEPTNNGMPEVTLKLEFPRYTSGVHFTDWDTNTVKKLDMTFEGSIIDVNYKRKFRLQLPNLKYAGVELPVEKGILKHPVEFNCLGADTAPAGMAGITRPFQADVTNRQTADVLA